MKGIEGGPIYSEEQRQMYRDTVDNLNTEKQARLEILSQYRKDLQTRVTIIKHIIEKFLDKDTSLAERIRTFIRKQCITITAYYQPFHDYFNNCASITGVFGGRGGGSASPPKVEEALEKWQTCRYP